MTSEAYWKRELLAWMRFVTKMSRIVHVYHYHHIVVWALSKEDSALIALNNARRKQT